MIAIECFAHKIPQYVQQPSQIVVFLIRLPDLIICTDIKPNIPMPLFKVQDSADRSVIYERNNLCPALKPDRNCWKLQLCSKIHSTYLLLIDHRAVTWFGNRSIIACSCTIILWTIFIIRRNRKLIFLSKKPTTDVHYCKIWNHSHNINQMAQPRLYFCPEV